MYIYELIIKRVIPYISEIPLALNPIPNFFNLYSDYEYMKTVNINGTLSLVCHGNSVYVYGYLRFEKLI